MEKKRPILENEHKNMPFYVCRLRNGLLTCDGIARTLEVTLDRRDFIENIDLDDNGMSQNPWIQKLTKRKNPSSDFVRQQLNIYEETGKAELADNENPVRWLGSGTILIVKTSEGKEYLVLNQRHKSFAWGGFFDGNGGYSSTITDMLLPATLALKELQEEVIITDGTENIDFSLAKSTVLRIKNPTRVIVHFSGQSFTTDNLKLIVDPDTATVDFRQILCLNIQNLDNLTFMDQETMFTNKNSQTLQERPILLFSLGDVREMFQDGKGIIPVKGFLGAKKIEEPELKNYFATKDTLTPTLRLTLEDFFE